MFAAAHMGRKRRGAATPKPLPHGQPCWGDPFKPYLGLSGIVAPHLPLPLQHTVLLEAREADPIPGRPVPTQTPTPGSFGNPTSLESRELLPHLPIDEACPFIAVRYSLARQSHLACPIHRTTCVGPWQQSCQALPHGYLPIWRLDRSIASCLPGARGNTSGSSHRLISRCRANPPPVIGRWCTAERCTR